MGHISGYVGEDCNILGSILGSRDVVKLLNEIPKSRVTKSLPPTKPYW